MKVDNFDFELPEDRIALRPAEPRESARLLVIAGGHLSDRTIGDLPDLLRPDDVLVFNDTKVIPAQLFGLRERDGNLARVEATLHMRHGSAEWRAFLRPAKRAHVGDRIRFGHDESACMLGQLDATVIEKGEAGEALLRFDFSGPALDDAIRAVGHVPIPPYIAAKRADDDKDLHDYQTIYAREEGAVAAPTAGLHFTPELFAKLDAKGIERHFVTLHVGAGTFLPVKADDTADHKMHHEIGQVSADVAAGLNKAKAEGRRIVAVGTTSLRLLESAADADGKLHTWSGSTDIFITPGYRFKFIDGLMTNFHLPRSTLFMLVSALAGLDVMREAYQQAINSGYRFYSYGDACLILPKGF
ncbi:MAG: tRNA preQ1(34) S-adenosylmethionine ribosyltransferase-isomerase QueA [Rhizobiaceae bacterium]